MRAVLPAIQRRHAQVEGLERLLRKRRRLRLNRRKKPELISTGRTLRLDVRRWTLDVRPSYGRDVSRSHREREQSFR